MPESRINKGFSTIRGYSSVGEREKYTGSVLLQKTLSICSAQFTNEGELEQVLIRNHHEAIITADDFENVQQLKNDCDRQNQIMKLVMR